MATLHFDTDAGRVLSNEMQTTCDTLQEAIVQLSVKVDSFAGNEWIGNSASQFQSEFLAVGIQIRNAIDKLETLRARIDREIVEWESAAQALA